MCIIYTEKVLSNGNTKKTKNTQQFENLRLIVFIFLF